VEFNWQLAGSKGRIVKIASIVLAAGYGTRMKSDRPKVVHPVAGRPMIDWCVRAAEAVSAYPPIVVVGYGGEQVKAVLADRCSYARQNELLGTGHAVQQAVPLLESGVDAVVVTYGDMPLLRGETLAALVDSFASSCPTIAMLTVTRTDPQGFGRILRNGQGEIIAIVEEADCTPEQYAIRELNPGIYCFDAAWLQANLSLIPKSKKGEYYLTDLVGVAVGKGCRVQSLIAPVDEVDGVNTRIHLAHVEAVMRRRILERHMLAGVTIIDPASTFVDDTVQIGADTTLLPGVILQGNTQVGRHALVGPHSQIVDSIIGNHCRVSYSVVEDARMDARSEIGPFGHLRKGAHLAEGVHMGNFGEVKNSYLGPGVKMGHFSYLGDAHVGENTNIGAGTITCNFDGKNKHKTVIENDVFIGSDTMLVAPLFIGAGARTGAGAVVTHDVLPNSTVYGVPARPPGQQQSGRLSADHKE
jgi:bifunctional UDP-N-acetylglucosamine pyrophosphorylase/glucosamine-1-phosphate N-acetyltransferase